MHPIKPESHTSRPESRVPGRLLTAAVSATLIVGGASASSPGTGTAPTHGATSSILSAEQSPILAERATVVRGSRNFDRVQAAAPTPAPSAPSDADERRMLTQARREAKAEAEANAAAAAVDAQQQAAKVAADARTAQQRAAKAAQPAAPVKPKADPKPAAPRSVPVPVPAPASGDAKAIGRALAANRGWGDQQFTCLNLLWSRESGWRVNAQNSSGAYGIPQAQPGSKMASVGSDWRTNPATQITWGLNYIQGKYGSPCAAWAHSEKTGWY